MKASADRNVTAERCLPRALRARGEMCFVVMASAPRPRNAGESRGVFLHLIGPVGLPVRVGSRAPPDISDRRRDISRVISSHDRRLADLCLDPSQPVFAHAQIVPGFSFKSECYFSEVRLS